MKMRLKRRFWWIRENFLVRRCGLNLTAVYQRRQRRLAPRVKPPGLHLNYPNRLTAEWQPRRFCFQHKNEYLGPQSVILRTADNIRPLPPLPRRI